jgi:hypothetical protein
MSTLREQIDAALKEHDEQVMSGGYPSLEGKKFIIATVHDAVDRLLLLAQTIDSNRHLRKWKDHGRAPDNILDSLVEWGQPLTRFLWLANLRDKIVDKIEYTHGVNFSGLRIYPQIRNKKDGSLGFLLFFNEHSTKDSVSISKNGEWMAIPHEQYLAEYEKTA